MSKPLSVWQPEFRKPTDPNKHFFEDKPFQYSIDQIDAAPDVATVTAYLVACAARLRRLGREQEACALFPILQALQRK